MIQNKAILLFTFFNLCGLVTNITPSTTQASYVTIPPFTGISNTNQFIQKLSIKKDRNETLTPTEILYLKSALLRWHPWSNYQCDWPQLISKIGNIERFMDQNGYVTFVHAHRWEWNFANDIWNLICAINNNHNAMSNRISLRFRDPNDDISQLYQIRNDLLSHGTTISWGSGFENSGKASELIFMNRTCMSNINSFGNECSGIFFLRNEDLSPPEKALEIAITLLQKYNLQNYIATAIELYNLHKQASNYGELLCISIRKDILNQRVYVATPGGRQDKNYPNTFEKIMSDNNRIVREQDYFDNGSSFNTCNVYCFAVSDIPGEYGRDYNIHAVNLAKPMEYQVYQNALQQLFVNIKQDQQRIDTDITCQKNLSLLQRNSISTRKYAKKNTSKALAGSLSYNQNNFSRQHKSSLHVRLIGERI